MNNAILDSGRNDIEISADIIVAYVSGNHVRAIDLPTLIASVHVTLSGLGNGTTGEPVGPEKPSVAQMKKSISSKDLISFEDGKSTMDLSRTWATGGEQATLATDRSVPAAATPRHGTRHTQPARSAGAELASKARAKAGSSTEYVV